MSCCASPIPSTGPSSADHLPQDVAAGWNSAAGKPMTPCTSPRILVMALMRHLAGIGLIGIALGSASLAGDGNVTTQERIIEQKLNTTESRVRSQSQAPIQLFPPELGFSTGARGSPSVVPFGSSALPGSRALSGRERQMERAQIQRDLEASQQDLRTLKTQRPNAPGIPLLERQLDRLNRPIPLGQPQPSSLWSPGPGSISRPARRRARGCRSRPAPSLHVRRPPRRAGSVWRCNGAARPPRASA
jgi:hypothetical protein